MFTLSRHKLELFCPRIRYLELAGIVRLSMVQYRERIRGQSQQ